MHIDQLLVVISRSPLRQDASDRVAVVASMLKGIRRNLVALIAEKPVLGFPEHRPGFLRRQAIVGAEIPKDLAGFFRFDDEIIQSNHSLDGLFPNLRRGPDVGEPAHHAAGIARMTAPALVERELMIDRNSFTRDRILRGAESSHE